jgi:hypothetical protein
MERLFSQCIFQCGIINPVFFSWVDELSAG